MKLNEQDSVFAKQKGNQRYLIKSSEKLKQIHKSKLSHSKQLSKNIKNQKSSKLTQKSSTSQWNTPSDKSSQSSVIILTPSQNSNRHILRAQQVPFLTQENEQYCSANEKSKNIKNSNHQKSIISKKAIHPTQNQYCSIHSYETVSDEDKSCRDQIYASMVLLTDKKSLAQSRENFEQKNQQNYIDLLSSENKIIPHQSSSPEVEINSSIDEYQQQIIYKNDRSIIQQRQPQFTNYQHQNQYYQRSPLQQLESNIIKNVQSTPIQQKNNNQTKDNLLGLSQTPFSSIKKRLFDTQQDFIGSQQENIDIMIKEIQSKSVQESVSKKLTFRSPQNSLVNQNLNFGKENRQQIVKVLEVVKMKNSSAKLAKVSVFIENTPQLQIKYVQTVDIRQSHPELLIQYYEETFDPYIVEIQEIF
ncbi:hypothetical protein TTHERM_00375060 (macronuclear) [Tetrahymena thermophila SB210]|uniref:Uncharacterized protein n=1 Tax=Tetrahymena thermophila (strain SB210) TaxID=312017 RepID=I7MDM1_TETTS|nr:hypothetical protein TTHERM_00375060 [Tetrahymena thermophila SB210]EAR89389.1 hypothetical protein TTHERM_00375060 [Tetrahymena thermophila SB210]|eukprot:XP_001009634.1 hypothetical protein TTHERM_00375060 [Tetrahymena thermophila SB210]